MARQSEAILEELLERIKELEHQADILKTILIVREPTSISAGETFEGLRKTVIAGATARRSHVTQLVQMAVAVQRATSIEDVASRIHEWLEQANVVPLSSLPPGVDPREYFEDMTGQGLTGTLEIVAPAYWDNQTQQLLRPGVARRVDAVTATGAEPEAAPAG